MSRGRSLLVSTLFRWLDCDRCDAAVTCHLNALLALLTSLGRDMSGPRSVCVSGACLRGAAWLGLRVGS